MKRGKRFFEDDNMLIYIGTAIFVVLAIAIGIIMYMVSQKKSNENLGISVENTTQINEDTESVSTELGKSVQDQEENIIEENTSVNSTTNSENNTTTENTANNTTSNSSTTNTTTNSTANSTTSNTTESNTTNENVIKEVKTEVTFVMPTEGEIICEYAKDNLIYSETLQEWITHTGIDIKADKTSVVKASANGIVKSIVNDPRYGLTIIIEHDDGYQTVYSNLLTAEFVVEGEEVEQSQTIGTIGNTAAFESSMEYHLHFELLKDGEYLDPSIYIKTD